MDHCLKETQLVVEVYLFILQICLLNLLSIVSTARLAQSVEHETLNLGVVGSSPTLGELFFICFCFVTILYADKWTKKSVENHYDSKKLSSSNC